MAIYLIRHAHAGARTKWSGDDAVRPLSAKGLRQRDHLLDVLRTEPIGAVLSSPSLRCLETVQPLAAEHGLTVQPAAELDEGADAKRALAFLLARAADNPAACSHGDLIPKLLRRLSAAGMRSTDENVAAKGSVWILEVDLATGMVTSGDYRPPP